MQNKNHIHLEKAFAAAFIGIVAIVVLFSIVSDTKISTDNSAATIQSTAAKIDTPDAAQGPINPPPVNPGYIYVTDMVRHKIIKFDTNGTPILEWGGVGAGNGQFNHPEGVAVDNLGAVYVADRYNNRIQKFDANGTFIKKWGILGTGNGQFNRPEDVAVDSARNVYVADRGNNRIQKFDSDGILLMQIVPTQATFDPFGIAVDSSGFIYVVDQYNRLVNKFNSMGVLITQWGGGCAGHSTFNSPDRVALDALGNVLVTDDWNCVQKFTSTGGYLSEFGSSGSGLGQFNNPSGIVIDQLGTIYVVDDWNYRVQKFNSSGGYIGQFGTFGTNNGQFQLPVGIAVGPSGTPDLVVTDLVIDPPPLDKSSSTIMNYHFTVKNNGSVSVMIPATAHFPLYKVNGWTQPVLVNDMTNLSSYLIPGGSTTVYTSTTNLSSVLATTGQITLELRADSTNVVREQYETNNFKQIIVTIVP